MGGSLNLAITGAGMVASLGIDVATCCAAARAGIVRPGELDVYPVGVLADGSIQGVLAHQVPMLTEGFEGDARLLRLIQGALGDLQRQAPDVPWGTMKTGFYLSLPDPGRRFSGVELIPEEEERKASKAEAEEEQHESIDAESQSRLFREAARLSGWPGEPQVRFVSRSGHAGVAEAVVEAVKDLATGVVGAAVVGGADSFLDEDSIAWLGKTFRLKSPENPMGLQPGEAGAFFLIENAAGARVSRGRAMGFVRAVSMGKEANTLLSGERSHGIGLVEAILAAIGTDKGDAKTSPVWIVTDQNGETYRASEWGHAVVRLSMHSKSIDGAELLYPATSFGDTGAASGAVAVCTAVHAFTRYYAKGDSVLIVSSSDGNMRAAVLLSRN